MPRARHKGRDRAQVLLLERERVRALQHDQARLGAERGGDGVRFPCIDQLALHAEARQEFLHQRLGPAVGLGHGEHVIARAHAGERGGGHGRGARGSTSADSAPSSAAELPAQDLDRRIVAARVDVARELVAERGAHGRDARLREDARLRDRRRHPAEPARVLFAELVEDVAEIHLRHGSAPPLERRDHELAHLGADRGILERELDRGAHHAELVAAVVASPGEAAGVHRLLLDERRDRVGELDLAAGAGLVRSSSSKMRPDST
jgi:hypothetical protein